jgi:IclR family transcriptional regulator, KDG regulon repressor
MKVPRTTSGKYVVEAVAKAFEVLESFNGSEELTLNEVSQRVGLNKSRTFRLLYTMAERGYVERNEDGTRYRLGMKLFERASNVRRDVKEIARNAMLELNQKFNEAVNLGVLEDGHVVYMDIVESSRPFRTSATVGCHMPTHTTALGKALLAFMPADDPNSSLSKTLAGLTAQQAQALQRELDQVRRRGYAVDDEENEPGVGCIGAPIFDSTGRPIAAMSVSGSAHRILTHSKLIAEAILVACDGVSRGLGFTGLAWSSNGPQALRRSASGK